MRFMSPSFDIFSRNDEVPDLAIVPRLFIRSSRVIPMPCTAPYTGRQQPATTTKKKVCPPQANVCTADAPNNLVPRLFIRSSRVMPMPCTQQGVSLLHASVYLLCVCMCVCVMRVCVSRGCSSGRRASCRCPARHHTGVTRER